MESLLQQEELVDHYVSQNNREAAVKLLVGLVAHYAKERKDFVKAEALRQKLFEIDEMALTEIVETAEIIEAARSESIDRDHLNTWAELYSALTSEEANTFYYALEEASYGPAQTVFIQGQMSSRLYLIDRGQLKLFYAQGENEVFSHTVESGGVVGQDTFFSNTLCTISLDTLSAVKLRFLDNTVLPKWRKDFPLLESKLSDYCSRFPKVFDLMKRRSLDRRARNRVKMSGKALVQFIGPNGAALGKPFKAGLSDIASGGLSFSIRISKEETARRLLGGKLSIKFMLPLGETELKIDTDGKIVAVHAYPFDDHSIHVRFDSPLDRNTVEQIERCPNPVSFVEG